MTARLHDARNRLPSAGMIPALTVDDVSRAGRSDWKSRLWGLGVSITLHSAVLGLMALICLSRPVSTFVAVIESGWAEPGSSTFDNEISGDMDRASIDVTSNPTARRATPSELIELANVHLASAVVMPAEPVPPAISPNSQAASAGSRGRRSTGGKKGEIQSGSGQTNGQGGAGGKGTKGSNRSGFFGRKAEGSRVVFVVDNSGSMNSIDYQQTQTRYVRVRNELVKSILEMDDDDEFFIVFFCQLAEPMPSRIMQRATEAKKAEYLDWVAEMTTGGGPTNPCGAMRIALRLQPDVIYFLTDGEFERDVNTYLLSIESDSIIHTFAFGEQVGEDVLKKFASHNKGDYKFVP